MKEKIVIIGVYYGKFPDWMQYWLKSCESNPTIDFLIVTDITDIELPSNVKLLNISMKQLKELAEEKMNMKVSLERPYKLCDFKAIYGLILQDYIQEYDYWGHCDFDLIWGDIRNFVDKYSLEEYEKFLPLGHLSLYRNTTECNNYYKLNGSKCGDYKEVYTTDRNYAFDEMNGMYSIYKKNKLKMFDKRIFAEIKTFHKRFRLRKREKNYYHQVFYYEKGKIYRAYKKYNKIRREEYIYIHFRRKLYADANKSFQNIKDCFYITKDGFFEKKQGEPTIEEIKKYNYNPGIIYEWFETMKFCFKNYKNVISKVQNLFMK